MSVIVMVLAAFMVLGMVTVLALCMVVVRVYRNGYGVGMAVVTFLSVNAPVPSAPLGTYPLSKALGPQPSALSPQPSALSPCMCSVMNLFALVLGIGFLLGSP